MASLFSYVKIKPKNIFAKDIFDVYESIQAITKKYDDIWVCSSSKNYRDINEWSHSLLGIFNILYNSETELDVLQWCVYTKLKCPEYIKWIKTEKFPFIKNRPGFSIQLDTKQDKLELMSLLQKLDKSISNIIESAKNNL
jgi:hypothetical protein